VLTSNDNGVGLVNFGTSKNLTEAQCSPHHSILKYTWTYPDGKIQTQIDHILIDGQRHSSTLAVRSFRAADCDTTIWLWQ
jgi:hypothetical protein